MQIFSFRLSVIEVLLVVVAVFGLTACQSNDDEGETLADALPLDQQKPTFVFFYTDN